MSKLLKRERFAYDARLADGTIMQDVRVDEALQGGWIAGKTTERLALPKRTISGAPAPLVATSRTTLSVAWRRTRADPPRPPSRGASRARRTPTADMPQRIADGCRRLPLGRPSRRTRKPAARRRLSSLLFIDEIDEAVKHAKHVPARVQPAQAARGHH